MGKLLLLAMMLLSMHYLVLDKNTVWVGNMSALTNPASGAKEAADAYIKAVLALIDGHEPLDVLATTAGKIEEIIKQIPVEKMLLPEQPGKWSIVQVVQHLADSELVWGYRLRKVMAEERPIIAGYDQDGWAGRLQYADSNPFVAHSMFSMLRESNLRIINMMQPEDLERAGVHAERGDESIANMIRLYAGHDIAHLRQLERIQAKLRGDDGP